ncbi:MAG: hypothetical protein ACI4RT_01195 [Candidatus Spyradenecus sp.]
MATNRLWQALTLPLLASATLMAQSPQSLIPETPNTDSPNYVCTWSYQDWTAYNPNHRKDNISHRDVLNHETLFGEQGWAKTLFPALRGDLIYLLDDGWDLPQGRFDTFGSLELHESKFPGYGVTPVERLKTLVSYVKAAGWKGCGVWICCSEKAGTPGEGLHEDYWRERIQWSKASGIAYWKIDWGNHSPDDRWRLMITHLADELYPELVIEHITGVGGTANDAFGSCRVPKAASDYNRRRGAYADVYRTYDVNGALSLPTTLDRVATQLADGYTDGIHMGLVNAEDEVHLCAAMGLTFGVMRYPVGNEPAGSAPNIFFGGLDNAFTRTRPLRKMFDEVTHAVMWARIAPPFRIDASNTSLAPTLLADSWTYAPADTWDSSLHGKTITQRAPAAIARGTALPEVSQLSADEPLPYVTLCRFPNGATAVGTYGRVSPAAGYRRAQALVKANAGSPEAPVGIFGDYAQLTLTYDVPLEGKRLYAQSLMGTTPPKDITDQVTCSGSTLILPGPLLRQLGTEGATDPFSEPALVLQFIKSSR